MWNLHPLSYAKSISACAEWQAQREKHLHRRAQRQMRASLSCETFSSRLLQTNPIHSELRLPEQEQREQEQEQLQRLKPEQRQPKLQAAEAALQAMAE